MCFNIVFAMLRHGCVLEGSGKYIWDVLKYVWLISKHLKYIFYCNRNMVAIFLVRWIFAGVVCFFLKVQKMSKPIVWLNMTKMSCKEIFKQLLCYLYFGKNRISKLLVYVGRYRDSNIRNMEWDVLEISANENPFGRFIKDYITLVSLFIKQLHVCDIVLIGWDRCGLFSFVSKFPVKMLCGVWVLPM